MAAHVTFLKMDHMAHSKTSLEHASRQEIDGVIRHVDAVNRDMTVLVGETHELIDVPSDCSVVLNGETVKLRLLQPGDHVRVIYRYQNNVRTAQCINAGFGRSPDEKASRSQNI